MPNTSLASFVIPERLAFNSSSVARLQDALPQIINWATNRLNQAERRAVTKLRNAIFRQGPGRIFTGTASAAFRELIAEMLEKPASLINFEEMSLNLGADVMSFFTEAQHYTTMSKLYQQNARRYAKEILWFAAEALELLGQRSPATRCFCLTKEEYQKLKPIAASILYRYQLADDASVMSQIARETGAQLRRFKKLWSTIQDRELCAFALQQFANLPEQIRTTLAPRTPVLQRALNSETLGCSDRQFRYLTRDLRIELPGINQPQSVRRINKPSECGFLAQIYRSTAATCESLLTICTKQLQINALESLRGALQLLQRAGYVNHRVLKGLRADELKASRLAILRMVATDFFNQKRRELVQYRWVACQAFYKFACRHSLPAPRFALTFA